MSVRVIKAGVLPGQQIIDGFCKSCGCVFEFSPTDALVVSEHSSRIFSIQCPTCREEVLILSPAHKPPCE